MKNIEVEARGLLSKIQYDQLKSFFDEHATFKEYKDRVLIDYSTFLEGEGIVDRKRDIRIRETNGIPEIIIKLGTWGGSESRREISFKGQEGSFEDLKEIFSILGFKKGILATRKSLVYDYKGLEFSLIEVPSHSFYFEVEKMIDGNEDIKKVNQYILEICNELKLSILDKKSFFDYIEILNKEVNLIFESK